jgi:hypothetical protein
VDHIPIPYPSRPGLVSGTAGPTMQSSICLLLLAIFVPAGNAFVALHPPVCAAVSIKGHCTFALVVQDLKRPLTPLRSGSTDKNADKTADTFSDRHVDKRGVTGRFSVFAEGLHAEEMSASEFRDALKEKMLERRRSSTGNKAAQDYM